jgi:Tfp pilus assembly protein PilN
MYDINLIRKQIVPARHKHVVFSVVSLSALVYVLTTLAVVFFSAANFRMIDIYASEIDRLEEDLSVLYPGTPTEDELETMIRRVQPDLREIKTLLGKRADYSVCMERVAACVPEDVWLTSVRMTERPQAGASRGKHRTSGSFHGIAIEGMVVAGVERGGQVVRDFATALEDDDELSQFIAEARFVETGVQTISGTGVLGFEVMCPYK